MSGSRRMLEFRSGGWILLLAALLIGVIAAWRLLPILGSPDGGAVGDGRDVATYGFDLTRCDVPRDLIVAGGIPKDGLPALTDPPRMTPEEADSLNREERGKYLVPTDRVIGVLLNGESRAYPTRVLNWHEVVNDTLGSVPVAVTFNPLCDSAVVFDRRSGGEVLEFGVSGLLYNSNLLMYDRRASSGDESLWSQLLGRAVAGSAAGRSLEILPFSLTTWERWRSRHPETTVLKPDRDLKKRYARNPYGSYVSRGTLRFPVRPLPPDEGAPLMVPLLAVEWNGTWRVFLLEDSGAIESEKGGDGPPLSIDRSTDPPSFVLDVSEEPGPPVVHAFRFAWEAIRDVRE